MRTILRENKAVLDICGFQEANDDGAFRLSRHCIQVPCEDGLLLHHTLTRSIVLIPEGKIPIARSERRELARRWFLVPQEFDEHAFAQEVRNVIRLFRRPAKALHSCTILTTTDCNARCSYCYEAGRNRITMTEKTAGDIASFLIPKASRDALKMRWFGGEPLMNTDAIDSICQRLNEAGITVESEMATNGLLLTPELSARARDEWNLNRVQITIDGTAPIYKERKSYVGDPGDPFATVMENIKGALEAGIMVAVRLNMDRGNHADLMELVDWMSKAFGEQENLSVYAMPIKEYRTKVDQFDDEQLHDAYVELLEKIEMAGLAGSKVRDWRIQTFQCMADDDSSIVILPGGELARCEHCDASDSYGSIYSDEVDEDVLDSWRKYMPVQDECIECALSPWCIGLQNCEWINDGCTDSMRQRRLYLTQRDVIRTYQDHACSNDGVVVRLGGANVRMRLMHDRMKEFAKDYLIADGAADFEVSISQSDIDAEKTETPYTDAYLETLAVLRKFANWSPSRNLFLVHGAAIEYDGKAYLFMAPSGTGKTTHIRLWMELFGARVRVINGDKPFLRRMDDSTISVYGSPWAGKERMQTNANFPLAGIVLLSRGSDDVIEPAVQETAIERVLRQVHIPDDPAGASATLEFVGELLSSVPVYEMSCTMNESAASACFEAITGQSYEDARSLSVSPEMR